MEDPLRYAISREPDDTVVGSWRGPKECIGFVTTSALKAGVTQLRAVDGSCAPRSGLVFKFAGDSTEYLVTMGRDWDTKTKYNKAFWDFFPALVNPVANGTAIEFSHAIPLRRMELTAEEYESVRGLDLPMGLGPRWKMADDKTRTENLDRRKIARFTNGQPAADWDETNKTLTVKKDSVGATVDIETLDGAGDVDQSFNDEVVLRTDQGNNLAIQFTAGVKTLDINTSRPSVLRFGDSTVLKIEKALVVTICAVNELRPGDNG